MIESCPKKRMIFGITCLVGLTVLVLIVESHWTDSGKQGRKQNFVVEQNSSCWERDKYEVIEDCEPCTEFELRSKHIGVCIHTHYKEVLRCSNGETVTRSCDRVAYFEERAFWRFVLSMFFGAVGSTGCVISRRRVLNARAMQRIQRQIANCV